jgi:hypothetical protein
MDEVLARGWANLIGRLDGPMHFRFIVQPTVAVLIALRAGLRDARANRPPFLWTLYRNPEHRSEQLRDAWKQIGTVFVVAALLDSFYQLRVHASVFALELLTTATLLALVPYVLVRGPVARIARLRHGHAGPSNHSKKRRLRA